jgi:hypothetical protein
MLPSWKACSLRCIRDRTLSQLISNVNIISNVHELCKFDQASEPATQPLYIHILPGGKIVRP